MERGKRSQGLARELPREARRLLREHVDSAGELDLLMLLHGDRARGWTVEQICTALRCPAGWAEPRLEALRGAGLFVCREDGHACAPATPELDQALQALEAAQHVRWGELTALIAAPSRSRRRSLTEGAPSG
ncbi:MAG: hypothetical protein ABI611_14020 [Solirubrobacteraceae bacterium]